MGLFKKYDLNGDGEIDRTEMETVVAQIKDSGDEDMSETMRETFDLMLKNFDENSDGKISISEFANAIKNMKV